VSNDPKIGGGPGDFDLDWGDALDDLDDGGKPLGGVVAPVSVSAPPAPSSRPLYRPPSSSPSAAPPPRASSAPIARDAESRPASAPSMPALSAPPATGLGASSLFEGVEDEMPTRVPRASDVDVGFLDFDDDASGATRVANIPRELIDSLLLARDEPGRAGGPPSLAEIVAAAPPIEPARVSVWPVEPAASPGQDDDSDIDAMLSVLDVGRDPAPAAPSPAPLAPLPPRTPSVNGPAAKPLAALRPLPAPRAVSMPPRPNASAALPRSSAPPPAPAASDEVHPPAAAPVEPERTSAPSPLASLLEPERASEPPPLTSLFEPNRASEPSPFASALEPERASEPSPLASALEPERISAPPLLPRALSSVPPAMPLSRSSAPPPLPSRGLSERPFLPTVGELPGPSSVPPPPAFFPEDEPLASAADVSFAEPSSAALDVSAFLPAESGQADGVAADVLEAAPHARAEGEAAVIEAAVIEAAVPDVDRPIALDADAERPVGVTGAVAVDASAHAVVDALEVASVPAAPVAPARPDRGAATALRTVKTRKPRAERFPLVGRSDDALRARAMLLVDLAERSQGGARARLLSAAAEQLAHLGRAEDARALWAQAREADPSDLYVLRTLRRDAVSRAAWREVERLLETEAALPLAPGERGLVLAALAELRLGQLGDAAGARVAAQSAAEAGPASVVSALLFAEAADASEYGTAAHGARERAAALWADPAARAALLVDAAREAERAGDRARAATSFARAAELDDTAFDAALGSARAARASGDVDAAAEAWHRASLRAGDARLATALRHATARLLDLGAARPADALRLLEGTAGVDAARARAEAAARGGDADARRDALAAWAASAEGTERAYALTQLADQQAAAGDFEGADAALREAALADSALGTVRVVREVLARQVGDAARLPLGTEAAGAEARGAALVAAAKAVREPGGAARERTLLAEAAREGEDPVLVDALVLDTAAESRDDAELRAALRRRADRASAGDRLGALLALADDAGSRGDVAGATSALEEALAHAPGEPLVTRALVQLAAVQAAPERAAAAWLVEASAAAGERAAFAGVMAARSSSGDAAVTAVQRALDAAPAHGPAWWMLESIARTLGDFDLLRGAHEGLAEHALDPQERAGRRVRAALLQPPESVAQAVALYAAARSETPDDAVIDELLARLGAGLSLVERAALAEAACRGAEGEWLRAARLRAAAAWEDAGEPARALALVRAVLDEGPDPFALAVRDRLEIAAGAVALVAERRFEAVRTAADDAARVQALERLAELDLHERGDAASAVLSLQALLELAPGHIPSLRVLERHFLAQGRDEELRGVVHTLATHLAEPADVAGWARFAAYLALRGPEASGDAADELLLAISSRARLDLWLARRIEAAAQARGASSAQILALRAIAESVSAPAERASAALRLAELLARTGAPADAAQVLSAALAEAPEHPVVAEELARLRIDTADPRGGAEALEAAARASRVPRRVVRLWHRAGTLWQDQADDADRALAALDEAAKVDVAYADVFERLAALLEQRGDLRRLADLTAARVAAGGEPAAMVALHERTAAICEKLGDRAGAAASLREALAIDPDRLDSLRRVAELCAEASDWRGAAEANIRIAKLTKELDELRDVFARLGAIYDEHIPDPRRAEAAYRRVLKLAPTDLSALARLARLLEREQQWASAVEVLKQLAELDPDPDQVRQHRFDLAKALESLGQPREAEATLEAARREAPTDPVIVRALADFYRRQDAQSALAMHLNRAVKDLRLALDDELGDASGWEALVEVFAWRGRRDAARVAAGAAQAVGVVLGSDAAEAGAGGVVPGAGAAAAASELDELLASASLPSSARQVFALAGEAIDKTVPALDLKASRAERMSLRDVAFRPQLEELARSFGLTEVEVWVTPGVPRACTAIGSQPATLLLGRDLLAPGFDVAERGFLLARALKVARLNLVAAVRAQPADLALAVAGMMRHFDPNYAPPGVQPAALDDAAKRFGKALPRKVRDELYPLVCEMMGAPSFDPLRLGAAATELAERVALLATGTVPAAVSALLWSAAAETSVRDPRRAEAVRRVASARALVAFAISDAHLEARQRTGIDRR
jgi:hypothetical protein